MSSDYLRGTDQRHGGPNGYARRKADRANRDEREVLPDLGEAVGRGRLYLTFRRLAAHRGKAAGPDGVAPHELSRAEAGEVAVTIAAAALEAKRTPSRTRKVRVRKPSGGHREISIASVATRGLHARLAEAAAGHGAKTLKAPGLSFGWRPKSGGLDLLAAVARAVAAGQTWVLLDDVKTCFDLVPVDLALRVIRERFGSRPDLAAAIEAAALGHPDERRTRGIGQGDPLSPLLMDLVLDEVLDAPLAAAGLPGTYLRYADNLVVLGDGRDRVVATHELAGRLLARHSLALKGEDGGPTDLAAPGPKPVLLGFTLSVYAGRLALGIPRAAWVELEKKLAGALAADDPAAGSDAVARGWVTHHGPAAGDLPAFLKAVRKAARRAGALELDHNELRAAALSSLSRWREKVGGR